MHLKFKNKGLYQLILFVVITLISTSCFRPKGVISQGKMEDVLTDMYKTDGCLSTKITNIDYSEIKSEYYEAIYRKYNITKAEFDSSLVYYSRNPKNLEDMYGRVINNLTKLQKDINKGKYHSVDSTEFHKIKFDIWNKQKKYVLTKDSARTKISFTINDQGFLPDDVFTLRFLHRIGTSDSSSGKNIRLQINYQNGRRFGIIKKVTADGITRRYTIKVRSVYPYKIQSVSGELLGCKKYSGKQDAFIDSIRLTRTFDDRKQDSLRKVLQKNIPVQHPVKKNK